MAEKVTRENLKEKFGNIKDFYDDLKTDREPLEETWESAAQLTLPYIFFEEGHTEENPTATPYNALGAYAVNNLASKLLVALLPPTGPFFRLLPEESFVKDLNPDQMSQLDLELSKVEQDVVEMVNAQAVRVPMYTAFKFLVITGNTLVYKIKGKGAKVFSPKQYVVSRDYSGEVLTAIIKEKISFKVLPKDIQEKLKENGDDRTQETDGDKNEVDVYTMIARIEKNKYIVYQEIDDCIVEKSIKTYTKDKLPYIVLRWTSVANEDYGRGLVEQYLGDFRSLEGLTQTIVDGAGVAAKQIYGLRPGATTKIEDLNNAMNGDVIYGDLEKDITTLQSKKGADFQIAMTLLEQIEQRLSRAFLMLQNTIRDSERTTIVVVKLI